MAISETVELLGKNVYTDIPGVLTLTSIPTTSELEYIGSEEFEETMLDKIFPKAIKEQFNYRKLLEIDFHWICRCLRILNYGPYYTTNAIFCPNCGMQYGEYRVDLQTIGCVQLPDGFVNEQVIPKDAFIDFDEDVIIKLPTIQEMLDADRDVAFPQVDGKVSSKDLGRVCYMIKGIGRNTAMTPVEAKMTIQNKMSPSDYIILKDEIQKLSNYGLRMGGIATCPKCNNSAATFLADIDDRFFRPTVGDLREWANNRNSRSREDVSGSTSETV